VSLAPLLGCPFGACFELADGVLVRAQPPAPAPPELEADERSNKALLDDGNAQVLRGSSGLAPVLLWRHTHSRRPALTRPPRPAQALTASQIRGMRQCGASGEEIVSALVASSATFGSKTAFSQEKYKLKKQRKYCSRVTAYRPTAGRVCQAFFSKARLKCTHAAGERLAHTLSLSQSPDRIAYLRFDTLALALCACDAASGGCVLVADGCGGLAAASVVERLGGLGRVCCVHTSAVVPQMDIVRFFNFGEAQMDTLRRAPLSALEAAFALGTGPPAAAAAATAAASEAAAAAAASADAAVAADYDPQPVAPAAAGPSAGGRRGARGHSSGRIGAASRAELLGYAATGGFGSLLCCLPSHEPQALLARLLPLLAGGAPFALFSNYLQPLADCAEALLRRRAAVCVELHEPWSREYQVLPQRTHPHMGMAATGGYLLIGTTVAPGEAPAAKAQRTE